MLGKGWGGRSDRLIPKVLSLNKYWDPKLYDEKCCEILILGSWCKKKKHICTEIF